MDAWHVLPGTSARGLRRQNFFERKGCEPLRRLLIGFLLFVPLTAQLFSAQSLFKRQGDAHDEADNRQSPAQTAPAVQPPTAAIYATFLYPWYKNPTVDGVWGNWEGNGHTPAVNWFSNYLPLPPGSRDPLTGTIRSSVGLYSSRDQHVFYWQLEQMARAHLEVAISSWWGPSGPPRNGDSGPVVVQKRTDIAFRQIITQWMNQPDNPYPNLRWTLYYEKESVADPSVSELASDLRYINTNYVNQPAFLKIEGRPVLFVYADAADGCSMVNRWELARQQSGVNFYLVLKLFSGFATCAVQPDSWHEYAPAVRSGDYPPYSSFISPGFWKDGDPVRLPRSLTEFVTAATAMVSAKTQWKLVETWNEWGEGTSVEPGIQVEQTTVGAAVVSADGAPFEGQYIDILAQQLPPLPAGTGFGATD